MLPLNHKRTTSSLAPPIVYVTKNWHLKDRRLTIYWTFRGWAGLYLSLRLGERGLPRLSGRHSYISLIHKAISLIFVAPDGKSSVQKCRNRQNIISPVPEASLSRSPSASPSSASCSSSPPPSPCATWSSAASRPRCSVSCFQKSNSSSCKVQFKSCWCQFHQHFTCNFFMPKGFAQLFSNYSLAM